VALHLRTDADVTLNGKASADFTLPKEQLGGRGFALQLFREMAQKHKTTTRFFGSYNQSKMLKDGTLSFAFNVPALQIKKNEGWMLVLYADELPSTTASPSASPKPSPSASAATSASPSASP
jgi:hypothetical protein